MSQEETRDVVGGQIPDTDRAIPEAFDEEAPGEVPVMGDRYRGEAAFFLEVVLILPTEGRHRRFVSHRLWGSNDAARAQVVQEVAHGLWITMPEVSAGSSLFQEEVDDGFVQIEENRVSLAEPSIEGVQEPQTLLHGLTGVTRLGEGRDERVQVRAE